MDFNKLTRRNFIKTGLVATAGIALYNPNKILSFQEGGKTRVVLVRNAQLLDKLNKPKAEIVQNMLDEAVTTLLEIEDPVKAWKTMINPNDIVGIKTNVWQYLPTPRELENAIKRRVLDAGITEENIGIKDRGVLQDPIFLNATALINTRPMRTHYWAGVGSLIKNYIMFVPNPSLYHEDSCADLASIWKLPIVAGKTRLNILVMFTPLFHGTGPHHYSAKYIWQYNGLIASRDPVAADTVGLEIIKAKRREYFGEDRPLNPPAKHILFADTRHHLGTADLKKIELIKIGWEDGVLI